MQSRAAGKPVLDTNVSILHDEWTPPLKCPNPATKAYSRKLKLAVWLIGRH